MPAPAPALTGFVPIPDFRALSPVEYRAAEGRIAAEAGPRLFDGCIVAPFFAEALYSLRIGIAPGLNTYAVDARGRLWIDPIAWDRDSEPARVATLLHEVAHVLLEHPGRLAEWRRDGTIPEGLDTGIAIDAVANHVVGPLVDGARPTLCAWWSVPVGPVRHADAWTQTEAADVGGTWDAPDLDHVIAAMLRRPPRPPPPGFGGKPGQGQGQGQGTPGPHDTHGPGADGSGDAWAQAAAEAGHAPPKGQDRERIDALRDRVAQAVAAHAASQGRGTGAGSALLEWARSRLSRPAVPWSAILRRAAQDSARTWAKGRDRQNPHRCKAIRGILRPQWQRAQPRVAIVLDVSGSMGSGPGTPLDRGLSELEYGIRQSGAVADVWLHDDGEPRPHKNAHDLRAILRASAGGGGTDMSVPLLAADAVPGRYSAIVLLSDCATPWPPRLRTPLVVAALGEGAAGAAQAASLVPSWARAIPCDCSP